MGKEVSLLCSDSIRLLEASLEALQLAVSSLGARKRVRFRQPSAEYAIETGLIGITAELAMAACVVQALGPSGLERPSGRHKTAGQILDDFREIVREDIGKSDFLVEGMEKPREHREVLLKHAIQFRRLMSIRAGGIHAGRGLLHEAVVVQANLVTEFLELLAESSCIRPCVPEVPRCQWYTKDRTLIVEDIYRCLHEATGDDQVIALASLYLVLPDIPNEKLDWLQALERLSISPEEHDLTYLLDVLENAVPASLRRVGWAGESLPVVARPRDPNAMLIAPHHMRQQFNNMADVWYSDIANTNGRLSKGYLHVPPADTARKIFALGLEETDILEEDEMFNGHQSWVHIVGSLATQGTPGPYLFIVRRTMDLGQLLAQLRRAERLANDSLSQRIAECRHAIETIRSGESLSADDPYFGTVVEQIYGTEAERSRLLAAQERNSEHRRGLPQKYLDDLKRVAKDGVPVGPLLNNILADEGLPLECVRYWSGKLALCAIDVDDLHSLMIALERKDLYGANTNFRKAFRRIDFRLHGPGVE